MKPPRQRKTIVASAAILMWVATCLAQPKASTVDNDSGEDGERPPATWLVTLEGQRIELAKPWRLDGRRVVFQTEAGTLSMARASEIDFEASREPAPEPVASPSRVAEADLAPALVLTDGDVARYAGAIGSDDESEAQEENGSAETEGESASSKADSPGAETSEETVSGEVSEEKELVVDSWTDLSEGSGDTVRIYGTLKNRGSRQAKRVYLRVMLLDETGANLATQTAKLVRTDIGAGKTSNFQVALATSTPYTSVEFEVGQR